MKRVYRKRTDAEIEVMRKDVLDGVFARARRALGAASTPRVAPHWLYSPSATEGLAAVFVDHWFVPASKPTRLSWQKSLGEQHLAAALGESGVWLPQAAIHRALVAAGYRTKVRRDGDVDVWGRVPSKVLKPEVSR